MTTTTTHPVRISCDCDTCQRNALILGKTAPLIAWITREAADAIHVTERNADSPRVAHPYVHLAHHPMLARAQRASIAGN